MKLTKPMIYVMQQVMDRGSGAWCPGSRAGGSTSRMWKRLIEVGYATPPPYQVTSAGYAAWLKATEIGHHARISPAVIRRIGSAK